MREIIFRGKDVHKGEWRFGFYGRDMSKNGEKHHYITPERKLSLFGIGAFIEIDIDEKTIGQYAGINDKNGAKIFEGDIVKDGGEIGAVIYSGCGFYIDLGENGLRAIGGQCEVIGNIHDNPEPLGTRG